MKKLLFVETSIDCFATDMVLKLKKTCLKQNVELNLLVANQSHLAYWNKYEIQVSHVQPIENSHIGNEFNIYQNQRVLSGSDARFVTQTASKDKVQAFILDYSPDLILTFVGPEAFKSLVRDVAKETNLLYKALDFAPVPGRMSLVDTCFSALNLSETFTSIKEPTVEAKHLFEVFKGKERLAAVRSDLNKSASKFQQLKSRSNAFHSICRNMWSDSPGRFISSVNKSFIRQINRFVLMFREKLDSSWSNVQAPYLFALQTATETSFAFGSRVNDTPESLMIKVSQYLQLLAPIVFRLHPFAKNRLKFSTCIYLLKNRVFTSCFETNPKDAITRSKAVIVWNGNIGFEAILKGKPVITLANSYYSGLGLTLDITTLTDIKKSESFIANYKMEERQVLLLIDSILISSFPVNFIDSELFEYVFVEAGLLTND